MKDSGNVGNLLPAPYHLHGAVGVIAGNMAILLEWSTTSIVGRATLMQ